MRKTFKYKIKKEMEAWANAFIEDVDEADAAKTIEDAQMHMKDADASLERANKLANILSATIMLEQHP